MHVCVREPDVSPGGSDTAWRHAALCPVPRVASWLRAWWQTKQCITSGWHHKPHWSHATVSRASSSSAPQMQTSSGPHSCHTESASSETWPWLCRSSGEIDWHAGPPDTILVLTASGVKPWRQNRAASDVQTSTCLADLPFLRFLLPLLSATAAAALPPAPPPRFCRALSIAARRFSALQQQAVAM